MLPRYEKRCLEKGFSTSRETWREDTDHTDYTGAKAAKAIAALVKKPLAAKIVPDMFDKKIPLTVAKVIR